MATVLQIITDAYRQSNLISIGVAPTSLQETEGLRYLNRIVKSVFGQEVGENLEAIPIGAAGISRPSGYPWWKTDPGGDWFIPKNVRLMLNLEQSTNFYLHPAPDDGSRFAVIDVAGNLSTYPVTVYGNGRIIESADSVTLNTNSYNAEWFYRADLATWKKYSPLAILDTFPFPEEFEDFFILSLAFRLNPAYQRAFDQQSLISFNKQKTAITARYSQNKFSASELGLTLPSFVGDKRDRFYLHNPNDSFDKGYPY